MSNTPLNKHTCKCGECGREMASWTVIHVNQPTCPRCGGLWLSIPRMGIYHICPDGKVPTDEDFEKSGVLAPLTVTPPSSENEE
jgi:DNA-directed RNA polymerase subunit RPC12/RpoP